MSYFFGDGAARQGALHETFNMAMLWNLPVVFIVENNGYAMGTSVKRSSNQLDLYKIGAAYDMPSYPVDGMNPESVHNAIYEAVEKHDWVKDLHFLKFVLIVIKDIP